MRFDPLHLRSHPDRSRSSGGGKDLARRSPARLEKLPREIPRPAGESAGLRDDASEREAGIRLATLPLLYTIITNYEGRVSLPGDFRVPADPAACSGRPREPRSRGSGSAAPRNRSFVSDRGTVGPKDRSSKRCPCPFWSCALRGPASRLSHRCLRPQPSCSCIGRRSRIHLAGTDKSRHKPRRSKSRSVGTDGKLCLLSEPGWPRSRRSSPPTVRAGIPRRVHLCKFCGAGRDWPAAAELEPPCTVRCRRFGGAGRAVQLSARAPGRERHCRCAGRERSCLHPQ